MAKTQRPPENPPENPPEEMSAEAPESAPTEEPAPASEAAAAPKPEVVVIEPNPLQPVKVLNHGEAAWYGSDYAYVGPGFIGAGQTGIVTRKKAEQLIQDYGAGVDGRGPFEIVEG